MLNNHSDPENGENATSGPIQDHIWHPVREAGR